MQNRFMKYALLFAISFCLLLTLCGCVVQEPVFSVTQESAVVTELLPTTSVLIDKTQETTGEPYSSILGSPVDTHEADPRIMGSSTPIIPSTGVQTESLTPPSPAIRFFDVYYDATQSMMGFVDIPPSITSVYELSMDLLKNNTFFPNTTPKFYRIDYEADDIDTLSISSSVLKDTIGRTTFYLSDTMMQEPDSIVLTKTKIPEKGRRINSYQQSFYEWIGDARRIEQQTDTPVSYVLANIKDDAFSVIVSDLSELNNSEAAIVQQIRQYIYNQGMSFAMIGVKAPFAGFVPIKGASTAWVQWGSLPSTSPKEVLKYRMYDANGSLQLGYNVPIYAPIDQRTTQDRPFYILCFGKTTALNEYIDSIMEQLEKRGSSCVRMVHLSDYFNPKFDLRAEASTVNTISDGVRIKQDTSVDTYFLTGAVDVANETRRTITTHMTYDPHPFDPRNALTVDDFEIQVQLYQYGDNGAEPMEIPMPPKISYKLLSSDTPGYLVAAEVTYPVDGLATGEYRVVLTLSLSPPPFQSLTSNAFEAYAAYGHQGENPFASFRGDTTLGLDYFIRDLNALQSARSGNVEIGSVAYELYVLK